MTTSADLANQALQLIAGRATLTGTLPTFDGSPLGIQVGVLYTQVRDMLLREQDFEFARLTTALSSGLGMALEANTGQFILTNGGQYILAVIEQTQLFPIYPWQFAYYYPPDCVRIRSIVPPTWNAFDPQPVRWSEMEQWVSGAPNRIIMCNVSGAQITYTTNATSENEWDPGYKELFIRTLGSELAMGVGGRPDFSVKLLSQAGSMVGSLGGRDS
jgi:hypothetical protein